MSERPSPKWEAVLARRWPVIAPCLLLVVAYVLTQPASAVVQRELTLGLIFVVLVVGYYSFAGLSGILSFGHISFMAVGAYVTALLTIPVALKEALLPDLPGFLANAEFASLPAALIAGAAAAAFAAVLAIPLMRLTGIAAAVSMFAVLLIVHDVAANWDAVSRGNQGMAGVPTNTDSTTALAVALLAVIGVYAFQQSRFGLMLRAARDDEVVARASGVDVVAVRRIAFILSGFIVGVSGFLFAQFIGAFSPGDVFLGISFLTIVMLVVGGQHSLAGAVVGATVLSFLGAILLRFEQGISLGPLDIDVAAGLRNIALAAILLVIMARRPSGLMRGREFAWRRPAFLSRRFGQQPPGDS